MSFTSYIILLHALLKQTIRHLTIGPSHCIIYYFTHLSNSVHGITKYCDLVLIIFYTPLKLIHGAILTHFCLVSIIFYTHLKPNKATKSKSGSFVLIIFYTPLKLPIRLLTSLPCFVPIIFYTLSNTNCTLSLLCFVLYPSYSTHLSNHST